MKNKRILLYRLSLLSFILLLGSAMLATTTMGLNSILFAAKLFAPGKLTYAKANGNLIFGAKLEKLSYGPTTTAMSKIDTKTTTKDTPNKIEIDTVTFKLNPIALLTATLDINDLALADVKVQLTNTNMSQTLATKQNILSKITGKFTLSPHTWAIKINTLTGIWQDLTVNGHAEVSAENSNLTIKSANLAVGNNFIAINNNNPEQLSWKIHIDALRDLHPEMHGKIYAHGTIDLFTATPKVPTTPGTLQAISGTIKADNLVFRDYALKTLLASMQYTTAPNTPLNLKLNTTGFTAYGIEINTLNCAITGTTINSLNIKSKHLQNWQLQSASPIIANAHSLTLEKLTLATIDGKEAISVAVNINLEDISAVKLTTTPLPLVWLQQILPEAVKLNSSAQIALEADYNHNNSELNSKGNLSIASGQAEFTDTNQQLDAMAFQGGSANFELQNHNIHLAANFAADQDNNLSAKLQIDRDQQLDGNITATFNDLSWIMRLCPDITRLKGNISGETNISGSLQQPRVITKFELNNGTLRIPILGVKIKPLTASLTSTDLGKFFLTANGTMRDGPGTLKLSGYFEPFKPGIPNEFELIGAGFEFVHTITAQLIADAKLKLALKNINTLAIAGDIKILSGTINLDDNQNDKDVQISSDVVFVDNSPVRTKTDFNIIPNLNLRIEKNVLFKGYGLDADISGKLEITKPAQNLLGNGRVSLKTGTYKIPGKTLYISHGRLIFPPGTLLNNPNLDIMMTTSKPGMQNITTAKNQEVIGIYIHGTASKPKLENAGLVGDNQAVNQILNATGSPVVDKIQEKFALEQFGVESNDENDVHLGPNKSSMATALDNKNLVIGKKLTDKIYLQYMKSLMDTNNAVRLKYALDKNWAVGVESNSTGNGADLSFAVHKN